jgi:hypothetical protein
MVAALMAIGCVSHTFYALSSVDNQHLQLKSSAVTRHPARPDVFADPRHREPVMTWRFWLGPSTATKGCSLGDKLEMGIIAGGTLC